MEKNLKQKLQQEIMMAVGNYIIEDCECHWHNGEMTVEEKVRIAELKGKVLACVNIYSELVNTARVVFHENDSLEVTVEELVYESWGSHGIWEEAYTANYDNAVTNFR